MLKLFVYAIDNQILQHETLGFLYQSVRVKISDKPGLLFLIAYVTNIHLCA